MQLLNIHLLIGKNKVTILPSSVQIIKIIDNKLIYIGCDYIAYRSIANRVVEKHKEYSLKIHQHIL